MADDKTLDVGIQAAGEAQNDDQQNHTVDDQTPVTQETQRFRQDLHDDTTEDGADNGAEAADDGRPQDNAEVLDTKVSGLTYLIIMAYRQPATPQ